MPGHLISMLQPICYARWFLTKRYFQHFAEYGILFLAKNGLTKWHWRFNSVSELDILQKQWHTIFKSYGKIPVSFK